MGTPPSGALNARGVAKIQRHYVRVSHLLMNLSLNYHNVNCNKLSKWNGEISPCQIQHGCQRKTQHMNDLFMESLTLFARVWYLNPLKPSVIIRSHFECSVPYGPNLPFLISDIRALWRSGLSARVPECQKLKTVGQARMAKCTDLRSWALKG